jgi:hypothetical protein
MNRNYPDHTQPREESSALDGGIVQTFEMPSDDICLVIR